MIDHLTLSVSDLKRSREFYDKAFEPLNYKVLAEYGGIIGYGDSRPYFWVKQSNTPTTPTHLAFVAIDRDAVTDFYKAALAAGARDDGAPGLREHYHPNYFAAFVIDPDGHPIEAVCHAPPHAQLSITIEESQPPARSKPKKKKPAPKAKKKPAKSKPRRR